MKDQGTVEVMTIHHMETVNFCAKFHSNSSHSCWVNSAQTEALHWSKYITIHYSYATSLSTKNCFSMWEHSTLSPHSTFTTAEFGETNLLVLTVLLVQSPRSHKWDSCAMRKTTIVPSREGRDIFSFFFFENLEMKKEIKTFEFI